VSWFVNGVDHPTEAVTSISTWYAALCAAVGVKWRCGACPPSHPVLFTGHSLVLGFGESDQKAVEAVAHRFVRRFLVPKLDEPR